MSFCTVFDRNILPPGIYTLKNMCFPLNLVGNIFPRNMLPMYSCIPSRIFQPEFCGHMVMMCFRKADPRSRAKDPDPSPDTDVRNTVNVFSNYLFKNISSDDKYLPKIFYIIFRILYLSYRYSTFSINY